MSETLENVEQMIGELWRKCITDARAAGQVPASAVERLIRESRQIMSEYGLSKDDTDRLLYQIYESIHWDGDQPTDRVFETMLEFDLAGFFKERGWES